MRIKNKILMSLIFTLMLIFSWNIVSFGVAQNYVTTEQNHGRTKTSSDGKYTQKSTDTVNTIFEDMQKDGTRDKYFRNVIEDTDTSNRLQMSYKQSMKNTEVAYCVNKGAHINSADKWLYYIKGYIEIKGSNVIVYKKNGNKGNDDGYTKYEYSNIANAQELAAAVSINNPFALQNGGSTPTTLGYGEKDKYNAAQQMVYWYWNRSNFLDQIGCSSWKHAEDNYSDLKGLDSARVYLENFMSKSNLEYEAQIVYLDASDPVDSKIYQWDDKKQEKKLVKDANGKPIKNSQQLILATGDGKEDKTTKIELTIKKKFDLNGASEDDVIYPEEVAITIRKKSDNSFVKTVKLNRTLSEDKKSYKYESDKITLNGSLDDYKFSEAGNSEWKLNSKYDWEVNNETSDETTKRGILTLTNKHIPEGGINRNVIRISGKVFLDQDTNKAGTTSDGLYSKEDKGIGGVEVIWRRSDGVIISSTKTGADGTYKMETSAKIWLKGYDSEYNGGDNLLNKVVNIATETGLYYFDYEKFKQFDDSYVEFKYNGVQYTTSALPSNANTTAESSKATTSDWERILTDSKFNEVTYDGVSSTNLIDGILNIIQAGSDTILPLGTAQNLKDQLTDSELAKILNISNVNDIYDFVLKSLGIENGKDGAQTELGKLNGQKNDGTYYKQLINSMELGGDIEELKTFLNTGGDIIQLDRMLELLYKFFKIKSQENGVTNQLLDIFGWKSTLDALEYILGNPTTYNITYTDSENSKVAQKIAQMNQNDLNQFKTTASTKGIIQNMLTGYTFSKSYKHDEYTHYCNPLGDVEKEYSGGISNKYDSNNLIFTFKEDITEKEQEMTHTLGNSIIDSDIQDAFDKFLQTIKLIPDSKVSEGTYKSFFKESLVNVLSNSHFGLNCNGFQMEEGKRDETFEQTKNSLIEASQAIPYVGEAVHAALKATLGNVHLYDVKYKVDTTIAPKFAHAYGPSKRTDAWDITNINCGLILREQPDAMIESDIAQVRVVMKGQEYTYNYKLRSDAYKILNVADVINTASHTFNLPVSTVDNETTDTLKVVMESITGQYTRKLNPANIAYLSEGKYGDGSETNNRTDEYQIYITYYIQAGNQSNTLMMRMNKIVNYYEDDCYIYDDDYTFNVEEDGKEVKYKNSKYWREANEDEKLVGSTGDYKYVVSDYDYNNNVWLLPGTKSGIRPITYKLKLTKDNLGILRQNKKLVVSNISEIASYTTGYGINTVCVNGESVLKHPWMLFTGYAGVDKDSRPGNAIDSLATSIAELLTQNGINLEQGISNSFSSLGDKLSDQTEKIDVPVDMSKIADLLGIDGLPDKIKNELSKLFATGITDELNKIAKQFTDESGINIYNLLQKMEDDTSMAPLFKLDIADDNYRIVNGKVFEDQKDESRPRERIGDGKYVDSEKGVAGVRVELHKVNDDGTHQIATLYGIDKDGNTIVKEAVTITDENGNYSFGNKDSNEHYGVIEDKYQLYYIYGDANYKVQEHKIDENGNKEQTINEVEQPINSTIDNNIIDARNYKSTIITDSTIKDVFKNTNSQNKDNWHIKINVENTNSASTAIDDINQRKAINAIDLTFNTYNNKYNIASYTNTFKQGIEYRLDESTQVNKSGEPSEDKITTSKKFDTNIALNFGIIERPREDFVVDKTISNIKLILANGQVLFDGNPYTDNLPYMVAVGTKGIRKEYDRNDRLVKIEMDTELMQGAELQITYQITVTNNSEIDYTTENYYYYGEEGNDNELVTGSVPLLVDYLDSDCEYDSDKQKDSWNITTVDDLKEEGLISDENEDAVLKQIKKEKYTVLTTDAFAEIPVNGSKSITLYATKLLSTKTDNYTFENHTEILRINGDRARTIKEIKTDKNTRIQVEKEYRPGNYIPSTASRIAYKNGHLPFDGMHEQDDDRIKIEITPPTGMITRDGYIAIAIISLIIVGIGAYVIKKKVLIKTK